jgi:hypothetical protein
VGGSGLRHSAHVRCGRLGEECMVWAMAEDACGGRRCMRNFGADAGPPNGGVRIRLRLVQAHGGQ